MGNGIFYSVWEIQLSAKRNLSRGLYNGFRICSLGRGLFFPLSTLIFKIVSTPMKNGEKAPITN